MKSVKSLILSILLMQLTACVAPSYYSQAISGHMKLMRNRQSIDTLVEPGNTDPELAAELMLAMEIREFATTGLGLDAGGSYKQFVATGQSAVTWNVVAAPEFSLEPRTWCFPVSGCVAYRGYFKQEAAEQYAQKLADKEFDVVVSPAIAYSTLGWFDDPLLDTMLQYDEDQLAAFIFHELAHRQLYVKDDSAFSEAYASFIEETGVLLWLQATGREGRLEDWRTRQQASREFRDLLMETRQQLFDVYASNSTTAEKRTQKAFLFHELEMTYRAMVNNEWGGQDYYAGWFSRGLNNAQMALVNSYQGGVCAFAGLYRSVGGDMARFQELAAEKAVLSKEKRSAWLNQPCRVIASEGNL
jgi:predicted aminopeptidase